MLELIMHDAGRGECLQICFAGEDGIPHHIIIDSGTRQFGPAFVTLCSEIRRSGGRLELLVITHVDEDHLGGLLYMAERALLPKELTVGMNQAGSLVLADARRDVTLSVRQSEQIVSKLTDGGHRILGLFRGDRVAVAGACLHILHPTPEAAGRLFRKAERDVPLGGGGDRRVPLSVLMESPLPPADTSLSNRASIVFVFEYEGRRLLFTGDAYSGDILDGVRLYAKQHQVALPVRFDGVKLPHHGSARNLSQAWPELIEADRYFLCADGTRHPDKLTIAKLVGWGCPTEVVSPSAWWRQGYFSSEDTQVFLRTDKLRLVLPQGGRIRWEG